MTAAITKSFNDKARWGQMISILFFAGVTISALLLFMLPHNLVYKGQVANVEGAWPILTQLFVVIGVTFAIGICALTLVLNSKKETIVYLDKKREEGTSESAQAERAQESDLVKEFRSEIEHAKNAKDALQRGLNSLCKQLAAGQGAIYLTRLEEDKRLLELHAGYALNMAESSKVRFEFGEGLVGQAALSGASLYIDDIPEGYITVLSGLGSASPQYLIIAAIKKANETKAVLELATFTPVKENIRKQIDEMATLLAEKI